MNSRYSTYRRIAETIRYLLITIVLVVFLFPFYWMLKTSFEPTNVIYGGVNLIPPQFTLNHYQRAQIGRAHV